VSRAKVSDGPTLLTRVLATGLLTTALVLVVGAVVGAASNVHLAVGSVANGFPAWFWAESASSALIFAVPGWYLATKRPEVPFGWLALAAGVGHGLAAAGFEYTVTSVLGGHHLAAPWAGLWLANWGPLVELPVLATIYALFPDGRRPAGGVGVLARLAVAIVGVGLVAAIVNPDLTTKAHNARIAALHNPLGLGALHPQALSGPALIAPGLLLATVSLLLRWRAATGDERRILSWLAGIAVPAVIAAPAASFGGGIGVAVAQAVTIVEILVVTAAVLRHRVYGIVVVLNRTLVYAALAGAVTAVYGATVAVGGLLDASHTPASVIGAMLAAFAFAPARARVERGVNRFLYGERDEPYAVLSGVAERLGDVEAAEDLLPTFVDTAARSLRLPYVAVELVGADASRTFEQGTPPEVCERFDLVHEGRKLGELVVGQRSGQSQLMPRERRLLANLAGQAAVAASNLMLTEDLRRSRERIVTAREEERRRLRRDLHDGLGPQLTGVALGLDVTSDHLVKVAPEQATAIDSLRSELGEAIIDIRRLVHDLRPPSLDELGLQGSLADLATRASRGDLAVSVTFPDECPPLAAAAEVAVYRIASEAINNVVRHSGATTCEVTLEIADDRLHLRVVDNGRGLSDGFVSGVGTISMRERAEEIGGHCEIASVTPSGCSVTVEIPIGRNG
jgi:two-component system, NarL family, sensor kinase